WRSSVIWFCALRIHIRAWGPIFSIAPWARRCSSGNENTANFNDEEPEFKQRTAKVLLPVTRFPDDPMTRFFDLPITRSPDHPISKLYLRPCCVAPPWFLPAPG